MSHIHDMYRFVKYADKSSRFLTKPLKDSPFKASGRVFQNWQSTAYVKTGFKRKYFWKSYILVDDILEDVIKSKFVNVRHRIDTNKVTGEVVQPDVEQLVVNMRGRQLIDKTFFIIPIGLWKAWYKDNGKFIGTILLTIVVLLTAMVGLLAKFTIFNVLLK